MKRHLKRGVSLNTFNNENPAVSVEPYEDKPWFRIDNAATLYAAARRKDWTRTFRTAVVLDSKIDPVILQKALEDTAKRFPFFCVQLRDGMFWS